MSTNDPAGALSEFVVSSTEIASFVYGSKPMRIWQSIRNDSLDPRLWQFRYDPIFVPEVTDSHSLAIESKPFGSAGRWRTSLTVLLDTPVARALAFDSVARAFPAQAAEIQKGNVYVLPIRKVRIEIPDLAVLYPEARVVDAEYDFPTPGTEFTVTIESPDEETARGVEKDLALMVLEYAFSFSAREARQNWVRFSMRTIKESRLFVELNGLGTAGAYVHRDDLRKLIENITNQVDFNARIEKPDDFEEGLFDKLLSRWNTMESSAGFDELKWQATYHADDLKPDVVTRELNEMFSKKESEDQWKYNTSFSASGKAGFLDILSAEASAQGSYSNEGLKKLLEEHSVKSEFEGSRIVAKAVSVHRVNLSDFNEATEIISVRTFVEPSENIQSNGFVELDRVLPQRTIHPDLSFQVAKMKQDVVFVGCILPFYGPLQLAERLQEDGWWVCDGRPIVDPLSERYHNTNTPQLVDRFLMGSSAAGATGGASMASTGDRTVTTYTTGGWAGYSIFADPRTLIYSAMGWTNGSPIESRGTLSSFDLATVPPYCSVIYLLKVR